MRSSNWYGLALTAGLALANAGGARAGLIDVQFGETADGIFGPTPHYTGAAVRGGAGDLWNFVGGSFNPDYLNPNAAGWGRSIADQPLFDTTGAATGVTLSLTTPDAFIRLEVFAPIFKGSPYAALMDSFVFADGNRLAGPGNDGPGTVTLGGLLPNHAYELILLSAGDVVGRQTKFTLDGTTELTTPSGIASFVEGDTYARFLAQSDDSGTLAFSFAAGNGLEGNLNGLQLLDVPAPGGVGLLALSLAGLAAARRRQAG